MPSYQIKVPRAVVDYFGADAEHAYIEQEFTPVRGWVRQSYRKRPSYSWGMKLRCRGVTHVALRCGDRLADFTVGEIIGMTGLRG